MSVKYTIIKAVFRILPVQQMMAKPYENLLKMFKTADAKPKIPRLENPDFTAETCVVQNFPMLTISHKKKTNSLCIYVAGGGMLKYPKPSQAKSMLSLAKETNRNVWLPYFPLAPQHDLFDALEF